MKLTVTRSGGFAGLVETLSVVDSTTLAPHVAREMLAKIRASRFFELPREIEGEGVGADFYKYEVAVTDGGQTHSVSFHDDGTESTKRLMELVTWAQQPA